MLPATKKSSRFAQASFSDWIRSTICRRCSFVSIGSPSSDGSSSSPGGATGTSGSPSDGSTCMASWRVARLAVTIPHRPGGQPVACDVDGDTYLPSLLARAMPVDTESAQRFFFGGVVRQKLDRRDAELVEHRRGSVVAASVVGQTEQAVGVDGVGAVSLQSVGANLVGEADAATFLPEVEDRSEA